MSRGLEHPLILHSSWEYSIMSIYCTYLTIYKGSKLPPFYIGSTSIKNIEHGYRGSVKSKKYKNIWKEELNNNPFLFSTKIISTHISKQDALLKEYNFQVSLGVMNSPMYINEAVASPK